ncbi:MAG TPA: DUF2961 domain-containing protein [Candidatus Hydrogenedentes bacterium]|nr:DUF2961 domain-containing protein [Candidatus Hydrogenedentota bacterium]HPG69132.1 DUF2961 domain-containing protein [Candidatus Hydrogenedentota bacterium]
MLAIGVAEAQSLAALAAPHEGRSMRVSSSHRLENGDYDPDSNWDNGNIKPGDTKVLADIEGPGEITHIWMTFLGPGRHPWAKEGAANHQEMLLRIFWDKRERPDVEAPVGEFFACGFGQRAEVKSVPVVVDDGDSYNCFWRMPFREAARVEVVNQGTKDVALFYYNLDWIRRPVAEDAPYFCARYNQAYPAKRGEDYLILDAEGKGHYVGTTLFVRSRSPMWFGEGDEKIYIDGEEKASIWGTGTEDYFLAAWGLKENSTPYFGTPWAEEWGVLGQRTGAYRWHVQDPIVFSTALRFTIEHYGWVPPDENPDGKRDSWNEREDDFASVAYWYQNGPSKAFGHIPPAEGRRLPSLDIATYPAHAVDNIAHGTGEIGVQHGDLWPEGQVFFKPASPEDAWCEVAFPVSEREPRRLVVEMTCSYDYGTYQAYLDGVRIGDPLDLYSQETGVREFQLLDFWPEPGTHTLRLEHVGRADRSTGDYVGLVAIMLRERRPCVKAYAYDRDKDWRAHPICY